LKKDADANDWMSDFENMCEDPNTFKVMMQEFLLHCPKPGRGNKRAKFDLDWLPTRLREEQPLDSRPRSCLTLRQVPDMTAFSKSQQNSGPFMIACHLAQFLLQVATECT
jgi:hypothetical protein